MSVLKSLQGLVTSTRSRMQKQGTNRAEEDDKSDGKDQKEEKGRERRGETEQAEE